MEKENSFMDFILKPEKIILVFIVALFFSVFLCESIKAADNTKESNNITIVIDPGHGGPDSDETNLGACYNGIVEKEINLNTALALKAELERYENVTVYLTRDYDVALTLKQRVEYAKKQSADVLISIHHNASAKHLFYGSEVFVPSSGKEYAKGYGIGSCILRNLVKEGLANKGVKTRIGKNGDYYGLIRHGKSVGIPTIIVEHGYIDNYHDLSRFDEACDCERMGILDARAIASYYGLKMGVEKKKIIPTINVKAPAGIVSDDTSGPTDAVLTVEYYNPSTGEVRYSMTAKEPESRCMYFGSSIFTTVNEKGVKVPLLTDLNLWGQGKKVKGKMYVPMGYKGNIYGICYNNYNLESNTAVAKLNGAVGVK